MIWRLHRAAPGSGGVKRERGCLAMEVVQESAYRFVIPRQGRMRVPAVVNGRSS